MSTSEVVPHVPDLEVSFEACRHDLLNFSPNGYISDRGKSSQSHSQLKLRFHAYLANGNFTSGKMHSEMQVWVDSHIPHNERESLCTIQLLHSDGDDKLPILRETHLHHNVSIW